MRNCNVSEQVSCADYRSYFHFLVFCLLLSVDQLFQIRKKRFYLIHLAYVE